MKNLRRALSMMLAIVITASLSVSVSADSAKDYTDYSEVVNKDAVAMLTELGIINGYPTGDFQPAGVVTRAEMAKMIYVVLNSGNDQAPTPDAQRYSDVYKGHWAEGYVAFCDDLGIIDGMGDGTFAPSNPVTGVQAAKMLLVAMGYDSAVEGFTGTNWQDRVLNAAYVSGLLEGITASVNEACTRDNAAQLIYNALIGDCVSYSGSNAVATGNTLMGECFNLVEVTGVIVANEYANLFGESPVKAGYTEIAFVGSDGVDPLIGEWTEIDWSETLELGLEQLSLSSELVSGLQNMLGSLGYSVLVDVTPDELEPYSEAIFDIAEYLQSRNEVEYTSFVYKTKTDRDQIGRLVSFYAEMKDGVFSGRIVGSVIEEDCVILSNDGLALETAKTLINESTRYFENYSALWTNDEGTGVKMYLWSADGMEAGRGERVEYIDTDGDGIAEIVSKTRQTFAVAQYDNDSDTWSFASDDMELIKWTDIPAENVVFDGEEMAGGMKVLVLPIDGIYYVKEADCVVGAPSDAYYSAEDEAWIVEIGGIKYFESDLRGVEYPESFSCDVEAMEISKTYTCYLDDFGNIIAYQEFS